MSQEDKKRAVARAALEHVEPGSVLGVGTGSTADCFIDALAAHRARIETTVASSEASARRLRARGIRVADLDAVDTVALYVDGADECTAHRHLIKGGGGALTREKILAAAAERFVCIVDDSKVVDVLGRFPLPVEVIPMARGLVSRALARLGGIPRWREGLVTDNGNVIVDVHGLEILAPRELETELNQLVGAVCNGLFARRPADVLLVGGERGVRTIT